MSSVKEFYVRAIGQLVIVTNINEAEFLIKNIFIVMLSEYEGMSNGIDTPCEVSKQFLLQSLLMNLNNLLFKVLWKTNQQKILRK